MKWFEAFCVEHERPFSFDSRFVSVYGDSWKDLKAEDILRLKILGELQQLMKFQALSTLLRNKNRKNGLKTQFKKLFVILKFCLTNFGEFEIFDVRLIETWNIFFSVLSQHLKSQIDSRESSVT